MDPVSAGKTRRRPWRGRLLAAGVVLILAAAVATVVLWVFVFPFRMDRLWNALPPNAVAVSIHRDLDSRWPVFLDNPVAQSWLAARGEPSDALMESVNEDGVNQLLGFFRRGPALAAWTPWLGRYGRPALVVVGWAGGYTQLMRWGWLDEVFSDFTVEERPDGRRVWVQPQPDVGMAQTLSLAVHEGLFLAVLSDDPQAIDAAVERLVFGRRSRSELLPIPEDGIARDTLLWAVPRGLHPVFPGGGRLRAVLTALSRDVAALELTLQGELEAFPAPAPGAMQALPGLLHDMPSVLVSGTLPLLEAAVALGGDALSAALVQAARAHAAADAAAFAAISGGRHGGTMMRMRVPAVWAGLSVANPAEAARIVQALLDAANAGTGLGLVAEPVGAEDHLHVLTPVGDTFYRRLSRGERAAFAVRDGWLIMSSNLTALQRLLGTPSGSAPPLWAGLPDGVSGALWADCAAAATLGREALAGFTLVQILSGAGGQRYDTPEISALLEGLAALRFLRVRADAAEGELRVSLSAGAGTP